MTIAQKIKELLDKEHISYQVLEHNLAYTALETSQSQHVPGRQVVKAVIVEADGTYFMCVLPAIHKIDFEKLNKVLNKPNVHLADEGHIVRLFPGYAVGAMPPFGQMAGLRVYVDKILEENDSIVFNAGTHTDMVRIKFKDFVRVVKPVMADFGTHI